MWLTFSSSSSILSSLRTVPSKSASSSSDSDSDEEEAEEEEEESSCGVKRPEESDCCA